MSSRSTSNEKGAAEEPAPEQDVSLSPSCSSSTTTASYDPTVFQRPHPDDRGGADAKPRKKDGGEGKPKTKAHGKAKGKGALSLDFCGNCGAEGALRKCKQCGAVAYCGEACQRVSAMAGWRGGIAHASGGATRATHTAHAARP